MVYPYSKKIVLMNIGIVIFCPDIDNCSNRNCWQNTVKGVFRFWWEGCIPAEDIKMKPRATAWWGLMAGDMAKLEDGASVIGRKGGSGSPAQPNPQKTIIILQVKD